MVAAAAAVAAAAVELWSHHRLHMVSEPELAPTVPTSPHAHARIDDWREARAWIADRFAAGVPAAPAPATTEENAA